MKFTARIGRQLLRLRRAFREILAPRPRFGNSATPPAPSPPPITRMGCWRGLKEVPPPVPPFSRPSSVLGS